MNQLSSLIKETPESLPTHSSTQGHSEKIAVCEPGNRSSPNTRQFANTLVLDFKPPEL